MTVRGFQLRRIRLRRGCDERMIHTPITASERTVATQIPRLKVTMMQAAISAAAKPAASRARRCLETTISAKASGSSAASVLANVVGESKVKYTRRMLVA